MGAARISLHVRGDPAVELASDAVVMGGAEPSGTSDYEELDNKPSIEGNVLIGDKTLGQLGITADALGVTADSLGITAESLGLGEAGAYDIAMLWND